MTDRIEPAPSARARCRGCDQKIPKGEFRFGEAAPNPYGEGETHHWFHLACAADKRPRPFHAALQAGAALQVSAAEIPDAARLLQISERGLENPKLERAAKAERASSGRALCRHCRQVIDKGTLRVKIEVFEEGMMNPLGFVHAKCGSYKFGEDGLVDKLRRWSPALSAEDFLEFERELQAGIKEDPKPPTVEDVEGTDVEE